MLQGVLGGSHALNPLPKPILKVAELVMVMVPGSVEDERKFSTFKYICKTPAQQATSAAPNMLRTGVKELSIRRGVIPIPRWISAKKRRGINR